MSDSPRFDPELHAAVDELVSAWPGVRAKQMFGRPGWVVDGTMFAAIFGGSVIVKTTAGDPPEPAASLPHAPMRAYGKTMRGWVQVTVAPDNIAVLKPWLEDSYRQAQA